MKNFLQLALIFLLFLFILIQGFRITLLQDDVRDLQRGVTSLSKQIGDLTQASRDNSAASVMNSKAISELIELIRRFHR